MFIQLLIGAIMLGGIYGLLGLGYGIIYKTSGLLTFAQGEVLMIGAFLGYTFFKLFHMPFLVALLATVVIMFVFGFVFEKTIIRTILGGGGTPIHVVLATIGISIALQNLAALIWTSEIQQFPPIFKVEYLEFGPVKVAPESISGIVVALASMVLLHLFMNYTKIGTAMRAAAQDSNAASVCGINVSFSKGLSWAISFALAGISGIIIGPVYGGYMLMGALIGLKGFAAAVIGGYGNMYGAILGGMIVGVIETMAAGYLSSSYKDFIAFFVFIVFLVIKPTGIFNEKIIES